MSADEVVASVKDVITRIESVALCDEQEDTKHSIEDSIKLLVAKTQETGQVEDLGKRVNFLKTAVAEKKADNHNENSLIKHCLNRLETLNEEKAAVQAQIESIENFLQQAAEKPAQGFKQELQKKRDCAIAWKLLTNTGFDFSSTNISGYHFNKSNLRYRTFEIDPKDSHRSDKLWTVISENNKNDK